MVITTKPWDANKIANLLCRLYAEENGLEISVSLSPKTSNQLSNTNEEGKP